MGTASGGKDVSQKPRNLNEILEAATEERKKELREELSSQIHSEDKKQKECEIFIRLSQMAKDAMGSVLSSEAIQEAIESEFSKEGYDVSFTKKNIDDLISSLGPHGTCLATIPVEIDSVVLFQRDEDNLEISVEFVIYTKVL